MVVVLGYEKSFRRKLLIIGYIVFWVYKNIKKV